MSLGIFRSKTIEQAMAETGDHGRQVIKILEH